MMSQIDSQCHLTVEDFHAQKDWYNNETLNCLTCQRKIGLHPRQGKPRPTL